MSRELGVRNLASSWYSSGSGGNRGRDTVQGLGDSNNIRNNWLRGCSVSIIVILYYQIESYQPALPLGGWVLLELDMCFYSTQYTCPPYTCTSCM